MNFVQQTLYGLVLTFDYNVLTHENQFSANIGYAGTPVNYINNYKRAINWCYVQMIEGSYDGFMLSLRICSMTHQMTVPYHTKLLIKPIP